MSAKGVATGVSLSRRGMFCIASIVAEGELLSPRIGLGPGLEVGRRLGVSFSRSFPCVGVGVSALDVLSGELLKKSRPEEGVPGLEPLQSDEGFEFSNEALKSLTFGFCSDCNRLC